MPKNWTHIWYWRGRPVESPGRKGQLCRVLARGRRNTILVEFEDGYRVATSRHAVRLAREPEPPIEAYERDSRLY